VLAFLLVLLFTLLLGNPMDPGNALVLLVGNELLFAVAALATLAVAGGFTLPLGRPTLRQATGAALLGLGALLFSASTVARLYQGEGGRQYAEMLERMFGELHGQVGGLGVVVLVVLLVPVCEELLFRGVVQRALTPLGAPVAIVVAALVFGLFHGHPVHVLVAFLLGLAAGYALAATGTLWAPFLVHGVNNGVVFLVGMGAAASQDGGTAVLPWWWALPAVVLGFAGTYLLGKANRTQGVHPLPY
jgi:membrane protease YdiL (CAAX protease family)